MIYTQFYGLKYPYVIQMIYTPIYGFQYSYLIQIICKWFQVFFSNTNSLHMD